MKKKKKKKKTATKITYELTYIKTGGYFRNEKHTTETKITISEEPEQKTRQNNLKQSKLQAGRFRVSPYLPPPPQPHITFTNEKHSIHILHFK